MTTAKELRKRQEQAERIAEEANKCGFKAGLEEAARIVKEKAHTVEQTMVGLHLAELIRRRAEEVK